MFPARAFPNAPSATQAWLLRCFHIDTTIRLFLATLAFELFSRAAHAQSTTTEAPKAPAWVTTEVKAPRVSFYTFASAVAKAITGQH